MQPRHDGMPTYVLSIISILHFRKFSRKGGGELTILEMAGLGLELLRIHTTDPIPA